MMSRQPASQDGLLSFVNVKGLGISARLIQ